MQLFCIQVIATGVKEIKHKQAQHYYLELLGEVCENNIMGGVIDDRATPASLLHKTIKPGRKSSFQVGAEQLVIEDRAEGDPDDAPMDAGADEVAQIRSKKAWKWGPFTMSFGRRLKPNGDWVHQWETICPYHRDAIDAATTKCKRAVSFNIAFPVDEAQCILQLKAWALCGRGCTSRRMGAHAHYDILNTMCSFTPVQLNKYLADASAEPAWIAGPSLDFPDFEENASESEPRADSSDSCD